MDNNANDEVGIEFIPYQYIERIGNTHFNRIHVFEWILLHFKETFIIRCTPDWHVFAPMAIKMRTSTTDAWTPLTLRTATTRQNTDTPLSMAEFPLRDIFKGNSIYKHHVLLCACVVKLDEALEKETFLKWGGNLGGTWEERFNTYPIDMIAAYT